MGKLSGLALVSALSLTLICTGAQAATSRVAPGGGSPQPPGGNNGPEICVSACNTEELVVHPGCRPAGPVIIRSNVQRLACPGDVSSYRACGDQLAQLRRVTVGQVQRIGDETVHLVPLCDTVHHTLTEEQTRYLARGNVQGLIPAIGHNATLMGELKGNGYAANDVLGIALGHHLTTLYVSHR